MRTPLRLPTLRSAVSLVLLGSAIGPGGLGAGCGSSAATGSNGSSGSSSGACENVCGGEACSCSGQVKPFSSCVASVCASLAEACEANDCEVVPTTGSGSASSGTSTGSARGSDGTGGASGGAPNCATLAACCPTLSDSDEQQACENESTSGNNDDCGAFLMGWMQTGQC